MRKTISIILFLLPLIAQAQTAGNIFLFEEFKDGTIYLKNGTASVYKLNYHLPTNKICFINPQTQETNYVDNVGDVSHFEVQKRVFYYNKNKILELLHSQPSKLYVQYKVNSRKTSARPTYGSSPETTSIYKENSTREGLNLNEREIGKVKYIYWIEIIQGKLKSFTNSKQFVKIYPNHRDKINNYIKEKKIKFDNVEQVKELCMYATTLN